jgi:hypothetical protein
MTGPAEPVEIHDGLAAGAPGIDWEGDRLLQRPFAQTVVYEMNVRGRRPE